MKIKYCVLLVFITIIIYIYYQHRNNNKSGCCAGVSSAPNYGFTVAGLKPTTQQLNGSKLQRPSITSNRISRLTREEDKLLHQWYRDTTVSIKEYENRATKVGAICLKHQLSSTDIASLLGPAIRLHSNEIYYPYGPSRNVFFVFSDSDVITQVIVRGRPVKTDDAME